MDNPSVADFLRDALEQKQMSQRDLARLLDIDASNISKWLTNKSMPEPERWASIEEHLELAPNSIARTAGFLTEDSDIDQLPPVVILFGGTTARQELGSLDAVESHQAIVRAWLRTAKDINELSPSDRRIITARSSATDRPAAVRPGANTIERRNRSNASDLSDDSHRSCCFSFGSVVSAFRVRVCRSVTHACVDRVGAEVFDCAPRDRMPAVRVEITH